MHRALTVTGGVITSAGLVLAATFVVRALTVPAAVTLLGGRTWWPLTPKSRTAQRMDADTWWQTGDSDAQPDAHQASFCLRQT